MYIVLVLWILCDQMYLQRVWRTRHNGERNNMIQVSILIVKEKINIQLILTWIVYGKGEHVCIDNIKSKKLQPKPWRCSLNLTILSTSLLHTLYKLYKPHSQWHSLAFYTSYDSSSMKMLSWYSSLPSPMRRIFYKYTKGIPKGLIYFGRKVGNDP